MTIDNKLTYLQKVALEGEIAFSLCTAAHDSEIKFRTYLILREVDDEVKPFIIDCIKKSVTFDEDIIDRIYLEVISNITPVWLWIEEVISEIKLYTSKADPVLAGIAGPRLSIDKTKERKKMVESAFIAFARNAIFISPSSAQQLFNEIQNDYELEFLHRACFYLQDCCSKAMDITKETEVPEELMSCLFDIKKTLNFAAETKALIEDKPKKKQYSRITNLPLPGGDIPIEGTVVIIGSPDIVNHTHGTQSSPDVSYVVKKVFTDSGLSTEIRTCKTEAEANAFIEKVEKEYPELNKVCEFRVVRINAKEKNNKWSSKDS